MTYEYTPHTLHASPVNPKRCKASVSGGPRSFSSFQCARPPVKDGWCKQHHPDAQKARNKAQQAKWAEERAVRDLVWDIEAQERRVGERAIRYATKYESGTVGLEHGQLVRAAMKLKKLKEKQR